MTDQPLEPDEQPTRVTPPAASPESEQAADDAEPPPTAPESRPVPGGERRLYRSRDDQVIAGVCGGLGRYLGIDPVLIRIAAVVLVLAGGAGILLYAIGWIAIPEEPEPGFAGEPAPAGLEPTQGAVVLGFAFVLLGVFFLVDELWPDFLSWRYVWPIGLIAVGLAILLRGRR